jgi:hypothetical protein
LENPPTNFEKIFQIFLTRFYFLARSIVIKPIPGIDPVKGPGPGFYRSTRVNSGQPGKIKIYIYIYIKVLIFI